MSYVYDKNNKRLRLFYLNVEGMVKRISLVLDAYKQQAILLKEVLELRSEENSALNNYIEKNILFSQDILGFVQNKLEFHFNDILKKEN